MGRSDAAFKLLGSVNPEHAVLRAGNDDPSMCPRCIDKPQLAGSSRSGINPSRFDLCNIDRDFIALASL
jgi:hypothetical protein